MNVAAEERCVSLLIGSLIVILVLARSMRNILWLIFGGFLAYRGLSGHCPLYERLDRRTDGPAGRGRRRVGRGAAPRAARAQHAVTINRPPEEVYRFFAEPEGLSRHLSVVQAVRRGR